MNIEKLEKYGTVLENQELKYHSTMRVGGVAKVIVQPENIEKLQKLIKYLKAENITYKVIGRGSNIIFAGDIKDRVIIKISQIMDELTIESDEIIVGAGYSVQRMAKKLSKLGYEGFEFAGGIPAALGGALYMNAGAHTGEFSDLVLWVEYINEAGEIITLSNEECEFGYRNSIFQKNNGIIIRAGLEIRIGDKAAFFKKMSGNLAYRKEMQPLDLPSCGSVFRNPPGNHAGKLIEMCGLKGHTIGGAKVSEKHANFIVNFDNAKPDDVINLINYVIDTVYEQTQIKLHAEMEFISDNDEK